MAHAVLKPSTLIHGRYKIVRHLNSGNFGAVYEVEDTHLSNRRLALKILMLADCPAQDVQTWKDIFEREMRALARLEQHPAIPTIRDYFPERQTFCLVMDFVEGKNLAEIIAERRQTQGSFTVDEVLACGKQLCAVIEFLHSQQPKPILFRDLKPANIMFTPPDKVRLIDFGLAGELRVVQAQQAATQGTTVCFGTPGYAAPEQYTDREPTDVRTDEYAICAILHELLTLADPTDKPFMFREITKLRPDIDPRLSAVIMRGLAMDKDERWQTVAELRQALENYLQQTVPVALGPPSTIFQPDPELVKLLTGLVVPSDFYNAFTKLWQYYEAGLLAEAACVAEDLTKRLDKAMTDVAKKLRDEVWLTFGAIREAQGNLKAAADCYQKSINANPQRQLAYAALKRVKNAPAVAKTQKAASRARASQATRSRFAQGLQSHFNWSSAMQLIWGPRWFIFDLTALFAVIAGFLWGQLTTPVAWNGSDVKGALMLSLMSWAWLGISRFIISHWRNKQKIEGFYYTLLILISTGVFSAIVSGALTSPPTEKSRVENVGERGAKLARVAHVTGDEKVAELRIELTKARQQIIIEDYGSARNSVVNTFRRWQEQLKLRDPAYAEKEHAQLEEYLRVFKMTPTPETIPVTAFHRSAAEIVMDEQEIAAIEHALAGDPSPSPTSDSDLEKPGPEFEDTRPRPLSGEHGLTSPESGTGEHGLPEAAPSPDPGASHDKDRRTGSDFDKASIPLSEATPEPSAPDTIPMPAATPSPEWGPDISP